MISLLFALIIIVILAVWAFKSKYPLAFMLLFAASFITSLAVFDVFDTTEALTISLIGIVFSFCMGGAGLMTMFGRVPDGG